MRFMCSICSDILNEIGTNAAAPCGHVFHAECISKWILENNSCPVCRGAVDQTTLLRLYFTEPTGGSDECTIFETRYRKSKADLQAKNKELEETIEKCKAFARYYRKSERICERTKARLSKMLVAERYQNQLKLKIQSQQKANAALHKHISRLEKVEKIINCNENEIDDLVNGCGDACAATKEMATYITALKSELRRVMRREIQHMKEEEVKSDAARLVNVGIFEYGSDSKRRYAIRKGKKRTFICPPSLPGDYKTYIEEDNYSPEVLPSKNKTDMSSRSGLFKTADFNINTTASSATSKSARSSLQPCGTGFCYLPVEQNNF